MLYIGSMFCESLSKDSRVTDSTSYLQSGIIMLNTVGGFTVLIVCTLSDDALYLYQVS